MVLLTPCLIYDNVFELGILIRQQANQQDTQPSQYYSMENPAAESTAGIYVWLIS